MALRTDDRGIIVACGHCGQQNRLKYDRLKDTVRCGRCKEALPAPAVPIEVTHAVDFDRLVSTASLPVIVDFWAPWCGPCRMVAPELEKVAARRAGRWIVAKVNTDAVEGVGDRLGIRSIPTLAVFKGGKEVGRTSGARPAADIETFVEQLAGNSS
jgi:thioredoxin 2